MSSEPDGMPVGPTHQLSSALCPIRSVLLLLQIVETLIIHHPGYRSGESISSKVASEVRMDFPWLLLS